MLEQDIERVIITAEQIKAKVEELGAQISKDYADKEVVLICLLNGAVVFMVDLARAIKLPLYYDFMSVSSYGSAVSSSGDIRVLKDIRLSIKGRHVIVVEDIIDTGLTLKHIVRMLNEREPASLRVCSLLDKLQCRQECVKVDYTGFVVPDQFIVGYGLDYAQKYRNLPYIGVLKKSVYTCE